MSMSLYSTVVDVILQLFGISGVYVQYICTPYTYFNTTKTWLKYGGHFRFLLHIVFSIQLLFSHSLCILLYFSAFESFSPFTIIASPWGTTLNTKYNDTGIPILTESTSLVCTPVLSQLSTQQLVRYKVHVYNAVLIRRTNKKPSQYQQPY